MRFREHRIESIGLVGFVGGDRSDATCELTITAKPGTSWDRRLRNREARVAGQTMLFTILGGETGGSNGQARLLVKSVMPYDGVGLARGSTNKTIKRGELGVDAQCHPSATLNLNV